MTMYRVEWAIDLDAESAEDAARTALTIQRDPRSNATVFEVREFETEGETEQIDLDAIDAKHEEDYLNDPRQ